MSTCSFSHSHSPFGNTLSMLMFSSCESDGNPDLFINNSFFYTGLCHKCKRRPSNFPDLFTETNFFHRISSLITLKGRFPGPGSLLTLGGLPFSFVPFVIVNSQTKMNTIFFYYGKQSQLVILHLKVCPFGGGSQLLFYTPTELVAQKWSQPMATPADSC